MRVQAFETLIRSESAALRVLRRKRYKNGRLFCHACGSQKLYRLGSGRSRCGRCRYTFGLFTGTWVGQARIALTTWLWLVKLFELEVTARQAAIQTGVNYPTALGLFTTIRRALVAHERPELLRGEVEADESYFGGRCKGKRGRGAAGKVPVFGILERRGRVAVTVVPNVTAQTLLPKMVTVVKRGSLVSETKLVLRGRNRTPATRPFSSHEDESDTGYTRNRWARGLGIARPKNGFVRSFLRGSVPKPTPGRRRNAIGLFEHEGCPLQPGICVPIVGRRSPIRRPTNARRRERTVISRWPDVVCTLQFAKLEARQSATGYG